MEHSKPPTAVAFWAPLKPTNPISSVREVQATNNLKQTKVWPQYFGGQPLSMQAARQQYVCAFVRIGVGTGSLGQVI